MTLRAPSTLNTLKELSAPADALSLVYRWPSLALAPRGDGRSILLLPGFRASPASMWPLAGYLTQLGYTTHDWRLGRNYGDVDDMVERVARQLAELQVATGEAQTLIGWSLGGTVARELARLHGEHVREIITFGSPIAGGPKYTAPGRLFARRNNIDLDAFEAEILRRNRIGFKQPITAIYSKTDGVVGWRAAVDEFNPQAVNVEVRGTHFGLGVNARVWRHIADTLAASNARPPSH
ncbi:MAG: alpha/beta hydrolase [Pseudomonadota bacterium]